MFVVLSLSIYLIVRHSLYEGLDESLRETASILANQIEYEHGEIIFEWEEGIGTNPVVSAESFFQYWDEKTGITTRSPALGDLDLPKFNGPLGAPDIETITIPQKNIRARAIGLIAYPYVIAEEEKAMRERGETFDPSSRPHVLVIARDATPIHDTLTLLSIVLTIGTIVTPVFGFLLIDGAIRSSLKPIHALAESVRNRSEAELDAPILIPGGIPAELSPLANSFDTLLSRVANIRNRERDFIRHASHELRTPIAGLGAVTELALSRTRTVEEYVRHLESCAESSKHLGKLVQRLSALARIGSRNTPPELIPISLREALTHTINEFAQAISASGLSIDITPVEGEFTALADPTLTALILRNLVDNAVCYSPHLSTIRIHLDGDRDHCVISLSNTFIDPPANPDRLFEPLFRRETSRSESNHLGIGLTLSREAAESMKSTLTADFPEEKTIRFTLSLPRA